MKSMYLILYLLLQSNLVFSQKFNVFTSDLKLPDRNQNIVSLNSLKSDFKIVYFKKSKESFNNQEFKEVINSFDSLQLECKIYMVYEGLKSDSIEEKYSELDNLIIVYDDNFKISKCNFDYKRIYLTNYKNKVLAKLNSMQDVKVLIPKLVK